VQGEKTVGPLFLLIVLGLVLQLVSKFVSSETRHEHCKLRYGESQLRLVFRVRASFGVNLVPGYFIYPYLADGATGPS